VIDSRYVLCALALAALPMCRGMPAEPAASPNRAPPSAGASPEAAPSLAAPPASLTHAPPPGYPGAPPAAATPMAAEPSSEASAEVPPMAADSTRKVSRDARRTAARGELERSEASLAASASDCGAACRALASMSRAVDHLCALVDSADDQRRCDDARRRMASARERVRQTCGVCSP
jgi:hypothetical protein